MDVAARAEKCAARQVSKPKDHNRDGRPANTSTALLELLELALFGIGGVGLSIAGAYLERVALVTAESGQPKLGAWIAFVGVMAFYFAYLFGTDKFGPKVAALRRTCAER